MLIKLDTKKYFTFPKFLLACLAIIVALLFIYYFLNQPPEESVGVLNIRRIDHTATLLNDGRILIVGGRTKLSSNTAEIYDPKTNISRLLKSRTNLPHKRHTAHVLRNGTVVIIDKNGIEEFDPKTETFKFTTKIIYPRDVWSEHVLPDERILIIGGYNYCNEDDPTITECGNRQKIDTPTLLFDPKEKSIKTTKLNYSDIDLLNEIKVGNSIFKFDCSTNCIYKFNPKDKAYGKYNCNFLSREQVNNLEYYTSGSSNDLTFLLRDNIVLSIYSYNISKKKATLKLSVPSDGIYFPSFEMIKNRYILIYGDFSRFKIYDIFKNKLYTTKVSYEGGVLVRLKNSIILVGDGYKKEYNPFDGYFCSNILLKPLCNQGSTSLTVIYESMLY